MIEVPSIIWQLDQLLPHLSFVSLGTNDLSQFFFASDRNNTYLGERYDVLSPSFLRCLQYVAQKCKKEKIDLSVCGEMAGRPLDALALIGLGIQELSVSSSKIPALKKMIPTISCEIIKPYLDSLINADDHSIREKLRQFAQDHDIIVH